MLQGVLSMWWLARLVPEAVPALVAYINGEKQVEV